MASATRYPIELDIDGKDAKKRRKHSTQVGVSRCGQGNSIVIRFDPSGHFFFKPNHYSAFGVVDFICGMVPDAHDGTITWPEGMQFTKGTDGIVYQIKSGRVEMLDGTPVDIQAWNHSNLPLPRYVPVPANA